MENAIENNDRIKAKIKALLKKTTDNGASQAEMESALKKASELMLENFISEHDLKEEDKEKLTTVIVPLYKTWYDLGIFYNALAKLFDCEYYYQTHKGVIVFFGFQTDAELCAYFYTTITTACFAEKDKYTQSDAYQYLKQHYHGRTLTKSFIQGFLTGVRDKMRLMYQERQRNVPPQYGLMVIEKEKQVKSAFCILDLKINTKKIASAIVEETVYNQGLKKGSEFELTQAVAGENKNSLRLK